MVKDFLMISLFRPDYGTAETKAIARVLETGWSGLGPETEKFEDEFSHWVGMKYGIGMNSCTSALTVALKSLGVGPGDEVIVPSLTFVSTAHAVIYCGAVPVFCDVERDSLMIDWWSAHHCVTKRTKAIIAVNYAGAVPIDVRRTYQNIPVIWDCAHAVGATIKYKSDTICCWSFHSVKNLSCGDGGMITTDREDIRDAARKLRWMGIDKSTFVRIGTTDHSGVGRYNWEYECREIGFKSHMNDITAAIGRVQLEKLDVMQFQRRLVAMEYSRQLKDLEEHIQLPKINSLHGLHLFIIRTDPERRDTLIDFLKINGVQAGVHYKPVHLFHCYYTKEKRLPVVEEEWKRIISLPMHACLTERDALHVSKVVKEFFGR